MTQKNTPKIQYLTGVSSPLTCAAKRADLGLLGTPAGGTWLQKVDYATWAADNGCFAEVDRPGAFKADEWLSWLELAGPADCLWATVPDVVGDATATWKRSAPFVEPVRALGFPVATVLQNGLEGEPAMFAEMLDASDAVFIGGSPECHPCGWVRPAGKAFRKVFDCPLCGRKLTEWKLSHHAEELVTTAKAAGKIVHMGRVNSYKRLAYAQSIGCDSADGTYIGFGPDKNGPKVLGWLDMVNSSDTHHGI